MASSNHTLWENAMPERDFEVISISSDSSDEDTPSFAMSPIVTLVVGDGKVEYTAHRQLLVDKCPFFAKCLTSGTKEANTNVVTLPEDDADTVRHFIDFIYHNHVDFTKERNGFGRMKAYALAEKFGMQVWQNKLMNSLMKFWKMYFVQPAEVSWILDNIHESCPLHRLALDQFSFQAAQRFEGAVESSEREEREYHDGVDALCMKEKFSASRHVREAMRYHNDSKAIQPAEQRCRYHVHPEGETCSRKGRVRKGKDNGSRKRQRTTH
ncbi:hypothetical protein H2200_011876 [Cladophialophora chaetospira]|uniref:BTB domain-containing protein n=1 Tax=Cladophialophora chaetospira TaxID=386627 RepID=A0AA38WYW9_9EURO|nr:hypothetical protein H2200_011876 [Cladophialophora chaetospira]